MESAAKAISELEYCVARYGKEDSFTFAAYQALKEMKAMQARIDELSKDAARYRWFAENGDKTEHDDLVRHLDSYVVTKEYLDSRIDNAMKD